MHCGIVTVRVVSLFCADHGQRVHIQEVADIFPIFGRAYGKEVTPRSVWRAPLFRFRIPETKHFFYH
jgi:hypothetical protein